MELLWADAGRGRGADRAAGHPRCAVWHEAALLLCHGLPFTFIGPPPSMLLCPGIGEFQCYDRFMLDSLRSAAEAAGHPEWYADPYLVPSPHAEWFVLFAASKRLWIACSALHICGSTRPRLLRIMKLCRASPPRDGAGSYDFAPW